MGGGAKVGAAAEDAVASAGRWVVAASGPSAVHPGGTDASRSGARTTVRSPRDEGGAARSNASRACVQSVNRRAGSGSAIRASTAASGAGTDSGSGTVCVHDDGMSGDALL
jgi:hypothetical protein